MANIANVAVIWGAALHVIDKGSGLSPQLRYLKIFGAPEGQTTQRTDGQVEFNDFIARYLRIPLEHV